QIRQPFFSSLLERSWRFAPPAPITSWTSGNRDAAAAPPSPVEISSPISAHRVYGRCSCPNPCLRFAHDSPLEGSGFEPSVPRQASTGRKLLTPDHDEFIGRGLGAPDLALAPSKLAHAGVAIGERTRNSRF